MHIIVATNICSYVGETETKKERKRRLFQMLSNVVSQQGGWLQFYCLFFGGDPSVVGNVLT